MQRIFITLRVKKTGQKLQNRMPWNMAGDTEELDNLLKELKEVKAFANGEANKLGLKGSDVETEIEFKGLNQTL